LFKLTIQVPRLTTFAISEHKQCSSVEEICQRYLSLKLSIYEIHIFELWNEELNVKEILAVNNATYAVAKRKPEKKRKKA